MYETNFYKSLSECFNSILSKPEDFLTSNEDRNKKIKVLVKNIYDHLYNNKDLPKLNGLSELIIDSFGFNEIWAQIELNNENILNKFIFDVSNLIAKKKCLNESTDDDQKFDEDDFEKETNDFDTKLEGFKQTLNESEHEESNSDKVTSASEKNQDDSYNENESDDENQKREDKFFNLKDMEDFVKSSFGNSKDKDDSDEESVDFFAEDNSESENVKYNDFFDENEMSKEKNESDELKSKKSKINSFLNDSSADELSEDEIREKSPKKSSEDKIKSEFELRKERLKKKIDKLEDDFLAEKPWQLKGEVTAENRPKDSLLEEYVEFDVLARPPLVVTEETNMALEDIILQRIKNKAWDSVKRKDKPVENILEYKKELALNQEKSKESLAQIYEKEYLNKRDQQLNDPREKEEVVSPKIIECNKLIDDLFSKLDALSHFYFTPRLAKPDVKIINNLPAISMEEVAPVGISDVGLLAPEEIKRKSRDGGFLMSKEERTKTDKKRARRRKKSLQHKQRLQEESKQNSDKTYNKSESEKLLKQVTKDRNVKKLILNPAQTKSLKSSEKFFNQLQEQVTNEISNKLDKKRKKVDTNKFNAKKLKL